MKKVERSDSESEYSSPKKKPNRPVLILDIEAINAAYDDRFNYAQRIETPSSIASFLKKKENSPQLTAFMMLSHT